MTADAGLIEVTVDGRRYLGIPEEHAAAVATCIQHHVTSLARAAGADPGSVPLLALSMQLTVASTRHGGSDSGTSLDDPMTDRPLSVGDVATQCGISTGAIRRAARQGRLIGQQVGHFWTFRQSDVNEYAKRRTSA